MKIIEDCSCSFCNEISPVAIEPDFHFSSITRICPNCISKAKTLISEYRVNGTTDSNNINSNNEF